MTLPIEFYHQKAKIMFRNWDDLFNYANDKISSKDSFDIWIKNPQSIIIRQSLEDLKLINHLLINQKTFPIGFEPSLGTKFLNLTKSANEVKYYKFLLIKSKICNPNYLLLHKNEDVIPFCLLDINIVIKLLDDLNNQNISGKHKFIYIVPEENFKFENDSKTIRINNSLSINDSKKYYSKYTSEIIKQLKHNDEPTFKIPKEPKHSREKEKEKEPEPESKKSREKIKESKNSKEEGRKSKETKHSREIKLDFDSLRTKYGI